MDVAGSRRNTSRAKAGQSVLKLLLYALLLLVAAFTLFPVLYAFLASFKENQEIMAGSASLLPRAFTLDNYQEAWEVANFKTYTWNSIYMTFVIVTGTILTSSMGAYFFARSSFPGKRLLFAVFVSTMFISMGSITMFPLLAIAKALHINTTLWGVIIIKIFGINILNMYLIRNFIVSIPMEIDEAAKLDGCSFGQIFFRIIFPLLKPVIATVGLIVFRDAWNDYLLPMVFTIANRSQAPLVVGVVALKGAGQAASSWNLMLAGTMISIIPMLVVYTFLNRYFVAGVTTGAVKG
ncbi:MAG: arabinogalactan transporter permease [Paenibacillaceae bacterium]|jgi:multiple sugar transport system permease protein|nr:arabinogalactan transporter permease [Paenibacillaceae bacterium]